MLLAAIGHVLTFARSGAIALYGRIEGGADAVQRPAHRIEVPEADVQERRLRWTPGSDAKVSL